MEISNGVNGNWNWMIKELTQGRDFAKQLQNHLHPSTPHETREFLIDKILSTYNRALHVATLPAAASQINSRARAPPEASASDVHRRPSKKRKAVRWIKKVTVSSAGGGLEGLASDGYNWRKYGQKDILGAAFPRNYYRCTRRHTQSCPATKQVQKSDNDATTFQVIYKGHHTCSQSAHLGGPSTSPNPLPASTKPKSNWPGPKQEQLDHSQQLGPDQRSTTLAQPQGPQQTVEAEEALSFQSFSFPSAFLEANGAVLPNTWLVPASPATSDSNQLFGGSGAWTPESDINDHGASGSEGELDFTLDELGIDPNFPFDSPEVFSWMGSD